MAKPKYKTGLFPESIHQRIAASQVFMGLQTGHFSRAALIQVGMLALAPVADNRFGKRA
jgi:hypothetical protein